MKDRLQKILKYLGYTATRFADELGVQRSGISHILSGRNQPSYDFMVRILTKFPELDPEWLILGKGKMLKEIKNEPVSVNKPQDGIKQLDLFAAKDETNIKTPETSNQTPKVTNVTTASKVILLHSDGTFEEYRQAPKD